MKRSSYIAYLLLGAVITIIIYHILQFTDSGMKILGVLGALQLIFSIYSWSKITGSALTPYIIFLIAAYTFTFGQSILFVFDKVSLDYDLTSVFTATEIMPAQYLTLLFLNFLHIGGILSCRDTNSHISIKGNRAHREEQNTINQIKGIRSIGIAFICISILPYVIERITLYGIVSTMGYSGMYMQEAKIGISNILSILSQYFIPGVLALLLVETSKSRRITFIIILLIEACFWLYIGGRSNAVIVLAILMMYYHICVKPIKAKQMIVIVAVAFIFISSLSVIADIRDDKSADVEDALSEIFSGTDSFYDAISEMGGSMYPMIATMEMVPSIHDYRYGTSYLYSLSSVIPNLGFWDLHPAMKYGNLNDWLQKTMSLDYGPGYSIVAEAYINFGDFGFLIMIFLGYCFASILSIDIKDKRNPLLLVISFIFCFLIIKTVRNSFLTTVRSIFYYILPIYMIVTFIYNGRINKKIKS